jgi:hypothetical protein
MGFTMLSKKSLETSIYWQKVVFAQSRDPKQIERCRLAIAKLEAQLNELLNSN